MEYGRLDRPAGRGRPASIQRRIFAEAQHALAGHLRNRSRSQAFQKTAGFARAVLGIGREHDQEKSILGREGEARHIEHRMVRHGKPVQRQHSEDGGNSGKQNRHLESHDDECRPRMIRLAANIDRDNSPPKSSTAERIRTSHPAIHQSARLAGRGSYETPWPLPSLPPETGCRRRSSGSPLHECDEPRPPGGWRNQTRPSCRRPECASFLHLRLRQQGAHFKDRNHGQDAHEQEHQRPGTCRWCR